MDVDHHLLNPYEFMGFLSTCGICFTSTATAIAAGTPTVAAAVATAAAIASIYIGTIGAILVHLGPACGRAGAILGHLRDRRLLNIVGYSTSSVTQHRR
jgi:hypothetical protein